MIVPKAKAPKTAEQLEAISAEIRDMERELAEDHERQLDWDNLPSAEELAERQQRLSILPRLLRAAKLKRLEMQAAAEEARISGLRGRAEEAASAFLKSREERIRAEEAEASGRRSMAVTALTAAELDLRRTQRRLAELKEEA